MSRVLRAVLAFGVLRMCTPALVRAESAAVFLDGFFGDWTGAVEWNDPAGDGTAGVDFRALDLANDGEWLFVRFQTTAEVGLQNPNNLVLYLDTDANAATGTVVNGIGAELRWQFGVRQGTFYRAGGSVTVFQDDIRLRQLPSVTSPEFELAIGRSVRPDGVNLLFTGNTIRVQLRHEATSGDYAPNVGQTLSYSFDATPVAPPAPIPLERDNATDVRLLTWNVPNLELNGGGWNAGVTPSADRVLSALDPDILCFQEIYDNSAAATAALIETFLPSGPGEAWHARENSDVIVVSRFPVLGTWPLDGAAGDHNLGVLLDTQAALGRTMVLAGAHMFCCTDDAGRQAEADRIMSFWSDAKNPGGSITVPFGTAFVITGDLNLVGLSQQLRTLRTGDIVNNATFGADFAPDWDATPLRDLVSSQTDQRFAYTWRSDTSSFAPGRLDFIIYSDSVVSTGNHFSLYTPEMPAARLAQYGLQAADVTTVSDHLPHVADFRPNIPTDAGVIPAGGAWAGVRATAGSGRLALRLDRAAHVQLDVYDVRGAHIANLRGLEAPAVTAGVHSIRWNGRDALDRRAPAGAYLVRLVARAENGLVVATSTKLTLVR